MCAGSPGPSCSAADAVAIDLQPNGTAHPNCKEPQLTGAEGPSYKVTCTNTSEYEATRYQAFNGGANVYTALMCQAACKPGWTLGSVTAGTYPGVFTTTGNTSISPALTTLQIPAGALSSVPSSVPAYVFYVEIQLTACDTYPVDLKPRTVLSLSLTCCPSKHHEYY